MLTLATNANIALPFNTLPEKCVWSSKIPTLLYCAVPAEIPRESYPDAWYQGTVLFADDLWSYDSITGSTSHILESADYNYLFDMIKLSLDSREEYFLFMNKADLTGWVYKLN